MRDSSCRGVAVITSRQGRTHSVPLLAASPTALKHHNVLDDVAVKSQTDAARRVA